MYIYMRRRAVQRDRLTGRAPVKKRDTFRFALQQEGFQAVWATGISDWFVAELLL